MATTATKPATKTVSLPKAIFGVEVKNHQLLRLAYEAYLAEARSASAKTLKRGQVSGGGKKPWKQKGTGRARFGSSRNPIWRGGGIAFGPTGDQNFVKRLSTTQKQVALKQALSLANKAGKISLIETFSCPNGKTSETITLLKKEKVTNKQKVLLVVSVRDDLVNRATRNLQNLTVVSSKYLTVFDILNADRILISKKSLLIIEEWLKTSTTKTPAAAKKETK